MNELFDLRPTNKEVAFGIIFVFLLLVFSFVAGYFLGIDRTKDISNNGNGAQPISNELGQAGTNISNAKDGIDAAQGTAHSIGQSVDYIQGTTHTSAEIIAECKRIIETVRNRGKTDTAPH